MDTFTHASASSHFKENPRYHIMNYQNFILRFHYWSFLCPNCGSILSKWLSHQEFDSFLALEDFLWSLQEKKKSYSTNLNIPSKCCKRIWKKCIQNWTWPMTSLFLKYKDIILILFWVWYPHWLSTFVECDKHYLERNNSKIWSMFKIWPTFIQYAKSHKTLVAEFIIVS